MSATTVTSKGQVTIPKSIRQQLGICKGSQLEAFIVDDHIEFYIKHNPEKISMEGFAMLKSKKKAVPVDFDPSCLLHFD